jgi:hypothetical protein
LLKYIAEFSAVEFVGGKRTRAENPEGCKVYSIIGGNSELVPVADCRVNIKSETSLGFSISLTANPKRLAAGELGALSRSSFSFDVSRVWEFACKLNTSKLNRSILKCILRF